MTNEKETKLTINWNKTIALGGIAGACFLHLGVILTGLGLIAGSVLTYLAFGTDILLFCGLLSGVALFAYGSSTLAQRIDRAPQEEKRV